MPSVSFFNGSTMEERVIRAPPKLFHNVAPLIATSDPPESEDYSSDDDRFFTTYDTSDEMLPNLILTSQEHLRTEACRWNIIEDFWAGKSCKLVKQPKASGINFKTLFPPLYRKVKCINNMDELSLVLGVQFDWRVCYERAMRNALVQNNWSTFRSLQLTSGESEIEACFGNLVLAIAASLNLVLAFRMRHLDRVGGLLADEEYDIESECDIFFINEVGSCVLSSEVKTATTFTYGSYWFRKSRGSQTLTSLFSKHAPVFLLTQLQWKVFVENENRDAILSYPAALIGSEYQRSLQMKGMGPEIIQAIIIVLLARPNTLFNDESSPTALHMCS